MSFYKYIKFKKKFEFTFFFKIINFIIFYNLKKLAKIMKI